MGHPIPTPSFIQFVHLFDIFFDGSRINAAMHIRTYAKVSARTLQFDYVLV